MDPRYIFAYGDNKRIDGLTQYRILICALSYLAVNARLDVSLSVGLIGRKVSEPTNMGWSAAKRVLQYLRTTGDWRLRFGSSKGWCPTGFSDSNWAGYLWPRKCTSGFIFFYGSGVHPRRVMKEDDHLHWYESSVVECNHLKNHVSHVSMWSPSKISREPVPRKPTYRFQSGQIDPRRCSSPIESINFYNHGVWCVAWQCLLFFYN